MITNALNSNLPLIVDAVLAAILLVGVIWGGKRGLIKEIAGLAVILVALIGASFLARWLTPPVTAWVEPRMEERLLEKYAKEEEDKFRWADELKEKANELHINTELLDKVREKVDDKVEDAREKAVRSAVTSITGNVVHAVLFGLSFVILSLVLALLMKALNLFSKLPVLNFANRLGGAVLGLIKTAVILWVLAWVMRRLDVFAAKNAIENSRVLSFFSAFNPLDLFI